MSRWEMTNPTDFKGVRSANIEKVGDDFLCRIRPDDHYFNPTVASSIKKAKSLIKFEFRNMSLNKENVKWKQTE